MRHITLRSLSNEILLEIRQYLSAPDRPFFDHYCFLEGLDNERQRSEKARLYGIDLYADFGIRYHSLKERFGARVLPVGAVYSIQRFFLERAPDSGLAKTEYAFVQSFLPNSTLPVERLLKIIKANNIDLTYSWFEHHEKGSITREEMGWILAEITKLLKKDKVYFSCLSNLVLRLLCANGYCFIPGLNAGSLRQDWLHLNPKQSREINKMTKAFKNMIQIIALSNDIEILNKLFNELNEIRAYIPSDLRFSMFLEILQHQKNPFPILYYLIESEGWEFTLASNAKTHECLAKSSACTPERLAQFIFSYYEKAQHFLSEQEKEKMLRYAAGSKDGGGKFRYLIEKKNFPLHEDALTDFLCNMVMSGLVNQIDWIIDLCKRRNFRIQRTTQECSLSVVHKSIHVLLMFKHLMKCFPEIRLSCIAEAIGNIAATHRDEAALDVVFKMCSDRLFPNKSGCGNTRNALFKPVACMTDPFERVQYLINQVPDGLGHPLTEAMKKYIGSIIAKMVLVADRTENFEALFKQIQKHSLKTRHFIQKKALTDIFKSVNLSDHILKKADLLFNEQYFSYNIEVFTCIFEILLSNDHDTYEPFEWFFNHLRKNNWLIPEKTQEALLSDTKKYSIRGLHQGIAAGYITLSSAKCGAFLCEKWPGLVSDLSPEAFKWAMQVMREELEILGYRNKKIITNNILRGKDEKAIEEKLKILNQIYPLDTIEMVCVVEQAAHFQKYIAVVCLLKTILEKMPSLAADREQQVAKCKQQFYEVLKTLISLCDIDGLAYLFATADCPAAEWDHRHDLKRLKLGAELQANLVREIQGKRRKGVLKTCLLNTIKEVSIVGKGDLGFFVPLPSEVAVPDNTQSGPRFC